MSAKPWILATDGGDPRFPFGFICLRCGVEQPLNGQGMPMEDYIKAARAFRKEHDQCQRNLGL